MSCEKPLIVTTSWDDGSVSDLEVAELLSKYNIKGTFYIPKTLFDRALTPSQIVSIDKDFEVGAHTLNHVDLVRIPVGEARKEIEGSKSYLEELLGHRVDVFSYPNGKYDRTIVEIVKKSGFIAARTARCGGFEYPDNPYECHVTLLASDGSPLMALRICSRHRLGVKAWANWEERAKRLFDLALETGGVYHLYGHSLEVKTARQRHKLENVLSYISNVKVVQYVVNEAIFFRS